MAYKIQAKRWVEASKPSVTFGKKGILYLNVTIMRDYFKDVEWVEILYDDVKNSLALKPLKQNSPNSYHVKFSNNESKTTAVVACRAVLKRLNLKPNNKPFKRPATWNSQKKFLEIQL